MEEKLPNIFSSKLLLKFTDEKYNEEFSNSSYKSIKRLNFILSIILLFVSLLFFIFIVIIYFSSQKQFSNMNIYYEYISSTDIDSNKSGDIMVFYDRFIMIYKNITKNAFTDNSDSTNSNFHFLSDSNTSLFFQQLSNNETSSLSLNNDNENSNSSYCNDTYNTKNISSDSINISRNNFNKNSSDLCIIFGVNDSSSKAYVKYSDAEFNYSELKSYLRKALFSQYCLIISIYYSILNFFSLILSMKAKNVLYLKIHFFVIAVFIGINFHMLSGILRSYFSMATETLFLVISFQLFFQIIIILNITISWLVMLISSLVKTLFEMMLWYFIHFQYHQIVFFYFTVCAVGSLMCAIISYHKELSSKTEFYWNSKRKFKEYLFNLLYNIDQGFIGFKNNKVVFMNRFMEKILEDNELENKINQVNESQYSIKELINDKNSIINNDYVNIPIPSNLLDDSKLGLNSTSNYFMKENKLNHLLENFLENFSEINEKLPIPLHQELASFISLSSKKSNNYHKNIFNSIHTGKHSLFKKNSTEIDWNNNYNNNEAKPIPNKLTITKLFELLYRHKKYLKSDSFVYIGKITLIQRKKNLNNKSKKFDYYYNNQYELRVRILKEQSDDIMEIILNDISVLIKKERQKAIDQCRSMYLLKTAHEFINPINSSMELINLIEEDFEIKNRTSIFEIVRYLKNLNFIMLNYLKGFSYFCEIKPLCEQCNIGYLCSLCNKTDECQKCQNCRTCQKNMIRNVDLKQILDEFLEIFENILKFLGKKGIKINLKYDIKELFIQFDPDYLKSIIFNIVYYLIKNSDSSTIEICVSYEANKVTSKEHGLNSSITKTNSLIGLNKKNFKKYFNFDEAKKHNTYNKDKTMEENHHIIKPKQKSTQISKNLNIINTNSNAQMSSDELCNRGRSDTIEISVITNSMPYEIENLRFETSKEILNQLELYDNNIEAVGFDEFNKSFQIYIGILLCNLSNSSLELEKTKDYNIKYKFKTKLSEVQEKIEIFSQLRDIDDSYLNSEKSQRSMVQNKNNNDANNNLSEVTVSKSNIFNKHKLVNFVSFNHENAQNITNISNSLKSIVSGPNDTLSEISDSRSKSKSKNKTKFLNENFQNKKIYEKKKTQSKKKYSMMNFKSSNITETAFLGLGVSPLERAYLANNQQCYFNQSCEKQARLGFSKEKCLVRKPISENDLIKVSLNKQFFLNENTKFSSKDYLEILNFSENNLHKEKFINKISSPSQKSTISILTNNMSFIKSHRVKTREKNKVEKKVSFVKRNKSSENVINKKLIIKSAINKSHSTIVINDMNLIFNYNFTNRFSPSIEANYNLYPMEQYISSLKRVPLDEKKDAINKNVFINNKYVDKTNSINSSLLFTTRKERILKNSLDTYSNYMLDPQTGDSNNNATFKPYNSLFCKKKFSRRILVIDDEFLIRSILKRYFSKINGSQQIIDYTVYEAANVFEAINIIYNEFLEKKYIDYIIIDEQMPYIKGSHMIKLFKIIAEEKNFYQIKFISYSAFNTKAIKDSIKEKGASYIINKPISFEDFKQLINKVEENFINSP